MFEMLEKEFFKMKICVVIIVVKFLDLGQICLSI